MRLKNKLAKGLRAKKILIIYIIKFSARKLNLNKTGAPADEA